MDPQAFPEPAQPDDRPGLRGETTWNFLHRSTWARAVEIRAFYNDALAALPSVSRKPIMDAMRAGRGEGTLLELLVGQFLQLRGATQLDHEPEQGGRRVDWRAIFPDGALHVEAMAPIYNAGSGETSARHQRLLKVLEHRVPSGWWLMPFRLPAIPGHAPLKMFRDLADQLLAQIPPADTMAPGAIVNLTGQLPDGRVAFTALRANGPGGLGGGAMITHYDDSETVIRKAWTDNRRKRAQGRSVPPPTLLAMAGSFLSADLEDFEMALFGRDVRRGREPDGAMVEPRPPWSGVLAFPTVSPAGTPDPVLFVAPGYAGAFPSAVARLEVRRLGDGGLVVDAARDADVMSGVRWAQP